jgi:pimeloyl-ACP methyl ester carboxylesterase
LTTGLTYHVLEWDGGGDTTFVLVHGFTDFAWGWEQVAERLPGHVIAPDLRGHGDSDWIGAGGYYHFFDYLADLDEVIARFARGRLVVVGHSMGGSVSGYWAGTRPDKLSALVLVEGLGPHDASAIDVPARTAGWIDTWRKARIQQRVMRSLDEAAARLCKYDPLLDPALARRIAAKGTREVTGGVTWKHDPLHMTMGPYPYRLDVAKQFWARITCPVLCVDGGKSVLNLPADERARRRAVFASCKHEVIAEAGHAVQKHQPERLAELITAWAEPRSAVAAPG